MPNQPQTPQAGSSTVKASDGTPLNAVAVNLAKSIREQESGGDYNAVGDLDRGVSKGAYQFNKDNFKTWATQYGLDPSDFSPVNQDKVAYRRINDDLQRGLAPSEVAAKWNGATLKNGKYVANNPEYVEQVKQKYAKIVGAPTQTASVASAESPNALGVPQAQAATTPQAPKKGLLQKGLEFAFPILEQKERTPLQTAGDVGLSALTLIPGLGQAGLLAKGARAVSLLGKGAEAVNAASKVAKVGSEISKSTKGVEAAAQIMPKTTAPIKSGLLTTTAKGAGIGYAADVGTKLSQGKTDASEILTPGLGTATGGVLGAGGAALARSGESVGARIVNSLIKPLKKDFSYGKNPGRAVAQEGIVGNSFDDLASNIGTRRKEIGEEIGKIGDAVSGSNVKLSLTPALKPLDDAMVKAAQTNNQTVFNRLQQVKQALTQDLTHGVGEGGVPSIVSKGARKLEGVTYNEGQNIKSLIGDMTAWTGNPSDDKVVNAALQNVWRGVSDAQKKAAATISPQLRAQLEHFNERYGDLTSAEIATKYREAIHGRQNLISLGDKIFGGAGFVGGLLAGGPIGAGLGTAALTGASHLLGTPAAKTRVAGFLAKGANKKPGLTSGLLKTGVIRSAAGSQ